MPRNHLPSILRQALLALACVVAPALPARSAPEGPRNGALDHAVLASALAALRDRHVEEQLPAQRLAAGLRGLSRLEPALTVALRPDRIEISVGAGARTSLAAPPASDAEAWGRAGAEAMRAAAAASPRLRAADATARRLLVLEEMIAGLDPYSRVVAPREATRARALRLGTGDVGLTVVPDQGAARITALVPNGPAWRAGLAIGDRLIAIDGAPTRGLGPEALGEALAGEPASATALTVQRRGAPPFSVLVVRATAMTATARLDWAGDLPVISLSSFTRETDQEVARVVAGLAGRPTPPGGLVLDLRGNRGGLLQQAVGVADVFLRGGEVVLARGRHPDASRSYLAGGADLAEAMEVIVLVDGQTASAAEALAAALQDNGRARVIGSATRGKGLIQLVHPLPDGGEMHISWARLIAPSGYPLQGRGVIPDLCTSRGEDIARREAERLLAATPHAEAPPPWREASSSGAATAAEVTAADLAAERSTCPSAEGGKLDTEAALWLFRRSVAATAASPGGGAVR
ncbi:S41 family peptidase [Elioraea sp.]|uniref:S41 family peptidase n=1 Tax=Elioraea sp. TaxID=2185103 RepID=UPI0025C589CE|nr:S41 family peptidase [Elioraea sp.]